MFGAITVGKIATVQTYANAKSPDPLIVTIGIGLSDDHGRSGGGEENNQVTFLIGSWQILEANLRESPN